LIRQKAQEILRRLTTAYPDAAIQLKYANNLELVIATILSAQCTDVQVNKVTQNLFKKYRSAADFLNVPLSELENDIRTTGFYHNKAKNIQGCCQGIIERFGGGIPQNIDDLTSLPGIGRKTANVVLGNAFGIPGMVVDTHVKRISRRLGLTQNTSPEKIEKDLCALLPAEQWTQTAHLFIFHGRQTCTARNPACFRCVVADLCEWNEKAKYLNAQK